MASAVAATRRDSYEKTLALVTQEKRALKLGQFVIGINGMAIDGKPDLPTCARVGETLGMVRQSMQMGIGDFINWLELTYGEQASQVVDYETFGDDRTVLVWRWVAERVPLWVRRLAEISFTHHQLVAGLDDHKEQALWLQRAIDNKWSTSQLKAAMKEAKGEPVSTEKAAEYWLVVQCESELDLKSLMDRMASEGRTCRPK